jgi:acyl carrier protein
MSGMTEETHRDDIAERVIRVIAETQKIPAESISIDKTFEELTIDSLDGINIVFGLENEFNISIPDENMASLRSVRDAVEGVRQLVAAQPGPTA